MIETYSKYQSIERRTMRFNFGTDILNSSGEKVAELHQIVIDPVTDQVTALIANKGFLLPNDKVIPISLVMDSTDEYIKLYDFEGSYDDLDDYTQVHYVRAEENRKITLTDSQGITKPPLIAYPPSGLSGIGYIPVVNYPNQTKTEVVKNIPQENVDIPEDARVIGMNGKHVGNVEEVIVNPQSDRVTHFVISKGLLFNEEKLIPSTWVSGFDSDRLKLVVNSKIIEQLPEYQR